MNLWLDQAHAAAHCAHAMARMAVSYANEGNSAMARTKRQEARWWLRKARDYRDHVRPAVRAQQEARSP